MTTTIWSLLLVGALVALTYKRSSLKVAAGVMAAFTVAALVFGAATAVTVISLIVAGALGVLSLDGFRTNTVTKPILNFYKKILPPPSVKLWKPVQYGGMVNCSLVSQTGRCC